MSDLEELKQKLQQFNKERDWEQYHNPKDLALSLVLEATEVLEHFQWKNNDDVKKFDESKKQEIADELGDVVSYLVMLADKLDIDLMKAALEKLEKSALKYPVEKVRGKSTKYNRY